MLLLVTLFFATSDAYSASTQEVGEPTNSYQNLGLKNGEVTHLSDEESVAAQMQAAEGFNAHLKKSDPATRSTIRKTLQKQNQADAPDNLSDLDSALKRARALPVHPMNSDSSYQRLELQSGAVVSEPADRN